MKSHRPVFVTLLLLVLSAAAAAADVVVEDAWVREAPPKAVMLAGYLTLRNGGPQERAVVGVDTGDFERIELHRTVVEGGVARMEPVERLPVPAGGSVVFKPGADHLMLIGPKRPYAAGDVVRFTLRLDDGATIPVAAPVRRAAAGSGHHHGGGHH